MSMRTQASTLTASPVVGKSQIAVWCDLFKARLTSLVLITTAVGFYVGTSGTLELGRLANTLLGTALLAAGAAALNQLFERELDARMHRTQDRPLPSGRLRPETVLLVGGVAALSGIAWLALAVNWITSAIGAATLLSYLFVYTPLKRVTSLNTLVGAVPGALPPLMGWTAAHGSITVEGWSLFAILVSWQLPHFLAIAWMYREDYARAGFAMVAVSDPDGSRTSSRAFWHTLGLLPVSLFPFALRLAGPWYLAGGLFIASAVQFRREVCHARARRLFYVSILYLPLLLGLMVLDKLR